MARLVVSLLGPFQVALDGPPLPSLGAAKVRALLAYLAVEAGRPRSRSVLAGLLWPNRPEPVALNNLRCALSDLRQAIGAPVQATRDSIQINAADCWVDVRVFEAELSAIGRQQSAISYAPHAIRHQPSAISDAPSAILHLQAAVALYRGRFLEDLSLRDSPEFDEWALLRREQYECQVLGALFDLATLHAACGCHEEALACARRQIELSPWREEAHQQAMQALSALGRRSEALAQYEQCRRILQRDLGVEPARETTALYERIHAGQGGLAEVASPPQGVGRAFQPVRASHQQPTGGLESPPHGSQWGPQPAPFVAREAELARLQGHLEAALAGQGRVVCVAGEAGMGKSALLAEFARRAAAAHASLVVASGSSTAQNGLGVPYLPFRQMLQGLAGDAEAMGTGIGSPEQASRLSALLPVVARAIVEVGPGLVGSLVPSEAPALRVEAGALAAAGQVRLVTIGQQTAGAQSPEQAELFEQFARVLQAVARKQPLLLLLDDLQWAGAGTVALLFHLGRRLEHSRILLVGAYRPDEIALGRGGERHPLEPVLHELQRQYGDICLDLAQSEGRRFVDALVDAEPNRLGAAFRETLYRRTAGNALFALELLQGLKEQGGLVQAGAGCWLEAPGLDWARLPARVEAVIAERIGRLPGEWQALLEAAGVQGVEFTAEVVARVLGLDEDEALRRLSALCVQHGLVAAQGYERVAQHGASRYRFRHDLFQHYLYSRLDPARRARLHEAVGGAIEALYGAQAEEHAGELAHHFEAARLRERAIEYWLQAGRRAECLSAHEDAIALLRRALALLDRLPESPARAQQELEVQLALGAPLLASRGWGAAERAQAYDRALALAEQLGAAGDVALALREQADVLTGRGQHRQALAAAEAILRLAQSQDDTLPVTLAHGIMGTSLYFLGELAPARGQLEQAISAFDRRKHGELAGLTGLDSQLVALNWLGGALWMLGFADQAQASAQEALALARALGQPVGEALALVQAGWIMRLWRGEAGPALAHAEELAELARSRGVATIEPWATFMQGWAQFQAGQVEAGLAGMRRGVAAWRGRSVLPGGLQQLTVLVDSLRRAGCPGEALQVTGEALAACERSDTRACEAELWRLKGELLLDLAEAEGCFRRALEIAQCQEARSWELRAAMSLARLLERRGEREEGRALLAGVYAWFTEGFETADLREAKALLDRLSKGVVVGTSAP